MNCGYTHVRMCVACYIKCGWFETLYPKGGL